MERAEWVLVLLIRRTSAARSVRWPALPERNSASGGAGTAACCLRQLLRLQGSRSQVGLALSVQVYLSPMSVVEFTSKKGMGTKVSKESAREAEDPDYVEPEEDDDEARKGKRGRPARGSKSKDRAEGATAAATSELSGAIEAEGGGSANEDDAEPSRPTKSRKVDKAGKAAASSAGTKADAAGAAAGTSSRKQSKRAAKPAEEEEESSESDSYEYEEEDNGRRSGGGRGGGGEAVEASGRKGEPSASTAGRRKFARRFQKDLPQMLYGFGDVRTPLPQTVQLMEDLVVDYVTQVLRKASAAAEARQRATRGSSTSRIKEAGAAHATP